MRAATEKNDGPSMRAALDQLKYSTQDVVVVELQEMWEKYSKVAKKVSTAIKSQDIDNIILSLEDWSHGVDDPAYLAAMKCMDEYTEQLNAKMLTTRKS